MGASAKWLKSLMSLKKASSASSDHGEVRDKGKKKWRLWRSVSEGLGSAEKGTKNVDLSESSKSAILKPDAFTVAMATVARAPAKEFMVVKQEWAAIRIQTSFRRFLAKQALRALKSIVRIQAMFRGRMVRKQADMTLKCMQALVRVQSRVREQCMKTLESHQIETGSRAQTEKDEIRTKLQTREEEAVKMGRTLAYNRSQKTSKSSGSPNPRTRCPKNHRIIKNNSGWSCGESWMRGKYIGSPFSRKSEDYPPGFCSYSSEFDSVKVRKNNVTKRISAKPHRISRNSRSSSTQSSESFYDDYSASSSPTSESTNLVFSRALDKERAEESITSKPSYMNLTASTMARQRALDKERAEESITSKPCYMNLTASTMAKQRGCKKQSSPSTQRRSREEAHLGNNMMTPTRGSFSPINSGKLCRNFYPMTPFRRRD